MIFKMLWRKRMHILFGQYMSANVLDEIISKAQPTEWEAFLSILMPLRGLQNATREDLRELKQMIEEIVPDMLNEGKSETADNALKPDTRKQRPS